MNTEMKNTRCIHMAHGLNREVFLYNARFEALQRKTSERRESASNITERRTGDAPSYGRLSASPTAHGAVRHSSSSNEIITIRQTTNKCFTFVNSHIGQPYSGIDHL